MPWELLRQAAQRGTSVAVVLNRVPKEAVPVIREHLGSMLKEQGLGAAPLFTVAEIALADLGLAVVEGDGLDVVVGGLGLGYTAQAVLADDRVRSLHVIEALPQVIDWHRRGLLPVSESLTSDPRCHLVQGDFFAMVASDDGFGLEVPRTCHAILVDIDHSPSWLLHPSHASFYEQAGLSRLVSLLEPHGVFGLWSDEPPAEDFLAVLDAVFPSVAVHVVPFPNPYAGGESTNSVYVGRSGQA